MNMNNINQFLRQCRRVLYVSRRPDMEEYVNVAKVTGIGIIIIGVIGFIISLVAQLLYYI